MSRGLVPGRPDRLAPGLVRVVAPNPGMMTGPGTNTYIVGTGAVAVIDPGPAMPAHLAAIRRAAEGPIRWILVTHTHPDHSPAATRLARDCGAELIGRPPPAHGPQDLGFVPDRVAEDGSTLETADFTLHILHTPGHASNHVCYRDAGRGCLFTGDHIINGSTVVIDPPDGNMRDYLDSLERLRAVECAFIAPGHGDLMHEPAAAIEHLVRHRLHREAKVAAGVEARPGATLEELVPTVYAEVDPTLHRLASRSLLAHLEKLEAESRVVRRRDRWWPVPPRGGEVTR